MSTTFEEAADAIVSGDIDTLTRLLDENPELIHERSTRDHRCTPLHYVGANGFESYRQKSPKNAVEIAEWSKGCRQVPARQGRESSCRSKFWSNCIASCRTSWSIGYYQASARSRRPSRSAQLLRRHCPGPGNVVGSLWRTRYQFRACYRIASCSSGPT